MNAPTKNLVTDTHFYFYTNFLSNWYICSFKDPLTNILYNSTEQAFMWYKAHIFKDIEAKKLLETPMHPKDAKEIGRNVKNYKDSIWELMRYKHMVYVNYLKYTQDKSLRENLIDTKNKILVEASRYDNIWGVGLDASDPLILNENNWKGSNLLGQALMDVRNLIK